MAAGFQTIRIRSSVAAALLALAAVCIGAPPADAQLLATSPSFVWDATDVGSPNSFNEFATAIVTGDFDGDGFLDIAMGHPQETVGGASYAGAVYVAYGTEIGPTTVGVVAFRQGQGSVVDTAESGDRFGTTLAVGRFNDDTYDDLAIGSPNEDVAGVTAAGAVHVIYGSASGLNPATGNLLLHQDVSGVLGTPGSLDHFGAALATGDFDNDGRDELAVGVPHEGSNNTGVVQVFPGTAFGIFVVGNQYWQQGQGNVEGSPGLDDIFGTSLTSGDFDDDGFADLAVGVPKDDVPTATAGSVHVFYGSGAGLTDANDEIWHQDVPGVLGVATSLDDFGRSVSAGDFDGDGIDDLAVGVPGTDISGSSSAGAVQILRGSPTGLTTTGNQHIGQDFPWVGGTHGPGHLFGMRIAAGNFDGDAYADLAIAAPGYSDPPYNSYTGIVDVLYGSSTGLAAPKSQVLDDVGVVFGTGFGSALATGDLDGDGNDDVVVVREPSSDPQSGEANFFTTGCGNGLQTGGEQCDDGDRDSGDGCSALCVVEFCGDGVFQPGIGEQCDDGNVASEDGCSSTCDVEFCGDGTHQVGIGEECDDGDNLPLDGCDAVCETEDTITIEGVSQDGAVAAVVDGVYVSAQTFVSDSPVEVADALATSINADPTLQGLVVLADSIGNQVFTNGNVERVISFVLGLSLEPSSGDFDGDGLLDAFEFANGFDPNDPDEDLNGTADGMDDTDGDGLSNAAEQAVGTDPNVTDTDGDGLLDGVEIGTGVFGPQRVITTQADFVVPVVTADVDGDGDLDALSASFNDDKLAWYENSDGTGTFGPQRVISTTGDGACSLHPADVDGDGDADVLLASANDSTIAWYENTDGQGSFGAEQVISTSAAFACSVFGADVDGDGDVDALSGSLVDNKVAWYENLDGRGNFGAQQVISTAGSSPRTVTAADVDGDGDLDVLAASENDDEVAWYENLDGRGSFGTQQIITTLADLARYVGVGDLDGDGDLDVLSASGNDDEVAWYENTDGQGTFGAQQVITTQADLARSAFAADLDGDGDLDVLSASENDDEVAWYENTDGNGTFGAPQLITTQADGAKIVHAADVDGDGDLDVLVTSSLDDTIRWFEQLNVADPTDPDSDDDGLLDGFEVANGFDPLDAEGDADADGLFDAFELANGFDPNDPDEDLNGTPDGMDDTDGDGITNAGEQDFGTDPHVADTDGDGLLDGDEVGTGLFGPKRVITASADAAEAVFASDLDGDGDLDLVSAAFLDDEIAWHENTDGLGTFGAPQPIATGVDAPSFVVAADLDGDDLPDVLATLFFDDTVAWYPNLGNGAFGSAQILTSAATGAAMAEAVDLDGDDDLDVLAVARTGDEVLWFENLGGGSFGGPQLISTSSDDPRFVSGADLNGDGDLDVLVSSSADDEIAWHENTDGLGSFGPPQLITTLSDGSRTVMAADLDGDGDLDVLATAWQDDEVAWYENTDGLGSFGAKQVITSLADGAQFAVAVDLDLDGDLDAVSVSTVDNKVAWYENTDGLGSFGAQQIVSTQAGYHVRAADLDGDGDPDLVTVSRSGDEIAWYEQLELADPLDPDSDDDGLLDGFEVANGLDPLDAQGDADADGLLDAFEVANGFDPNDPDEDLNGTADGMDDTDGDGLSNAAEQAVGTDPNVTDTDGDGLLDGVEIGTGVFGPQRVITTQADFVVPVVTADVDGDGDLDALSASFNDDKLAWYENSDGTGTFGPQRVISTTGDGACSLHPADVDGDGDADVLLASANDSTIAWYENTDGQGSFGAEQVISTSAAFACSVFGADVDGDGDVDALSGSLVDNKVAWYENLDGRGNFGAQQVISTAGSSPRTVTAADVDGDGDLDVLAASENDDEVAWYENLDGRGSFGTQQIITTLADLARYVGVGDLDGDGDLDVLSASGNDDEVAWYENTDGQGTFGAQQVITTQADLARSAFAADLDGDGDLDVLSASENDDEVAWYENTDGNGTFGAPQLITTQADGAKIVHAADVDGDGDLDVLVTSSLDDTIRWFEQLNVADPTDPDSDDDGLLDGFEVANGFDPLDAEGDADADGLFDAFELANGFDPNDPDEDLNGTPDGQDDTDSDELSNLIEQREGTDPNDADSDDDGLLDGDELFGGVFGAKQVITTQALLADEVIAADVDGDGDLDVLSRSDGTLAWYENTDGIGTFGPQQVISPGLISLGGWGAWGIGLGDLDGDDDLDVVASSSLDEFAWYENQDGLGDFGPAQVISTLADTAISAEAADVDGDGDLDVVSTSFADDVVAWYENTDGQGSFGALQVVTTAGNGPGTMIPSDIDGDFDVDIVVASLNNDRVTWYENTDGLGSFGLAQVVSMAGGGAAELSAADLDGDGDRDLVLPLTEGGVFGWHENTDGQGSFGAPQTISTVSTTGIESADLDSDGDLDVLATHTAVVWYENADGLGTMSAARLVSDQVSGPTDVFAADLNGDGTLDVLSASSGDDTIAWYPQIHPADPFDPDTDDDGLLDGFEVANGLDPRDALGDADGDGLLDTFELANGFDPLDPDEDANGELDGEDDSDGDGLRNASEQGAGTDPHDPDTDHDGLLDRAELYAGSFGPARVITTLANRATSVFAADLDGDLDLDVLSASNSDNKVAWYENTDGLGSFGPQQVISTLPFATAVFAADLDGDLDLDVLSGSNGATSWHENTDGLGSFGAAQLIATLGALARSVAADLDGDFDLDVLSGVGDEHVWFENTNGLGSFGSKQTIGTVLGAVRQPIAADLDGDLDLDVAGLDVGGVILWYENADGQGAFGAPNVLTTLADGVEEVTAGDVDGDGDLDLVVAINGDHTVAWYENTDGQGSFGGRRYVSTTADDVESVFVADLDGDGDLDVASGQGSPSRVGWHENTDGAGSFAPVQIVSTLAGTSLFAADIDGDGDTDLLSASASTDTIAWYENDPPAVAPGLRYDPLDPDIDGDGLLDGFEVVHGLDPFTPGEAGLDPDADGLDNLAEQAALTLPFDPDTDDDGLLDGFEVANGFDPLTPGDEIGDPDFDGLDNLSEQTWGTDPHDPDTDGDGVNDGDEVAAGTDPLNPPVPVPALVAVSSGVLTLLLGALIAVEVRRRRG